MAGIGPRPAVEHLVPPLGTPLAHMLLANAHIALDWNCDHPKRFGKGEL